MRTTIGLNEAGQRVDKFSRKLFSDVPMSAIYKAIRKGDIRVNGKKVKEKQMLNEGDEYLCKYLNSKKLEEKKKNVTGDFINIPNTGMKAVYEDKSILIVEKWPGVLVHSDSSAPDREATLTDHALSYLMIKGAYSPEEELTFTPAACNRLDRNTSGMVIFGKTFPAMQEMNKVIRERNMDKYYLALVKGRVEDGTYTGHISKDESKNISKIHKVAGEDTKEVCMKVETVQSVGIYSLLEIQLITGRSHQIRAHLASLGNPIVGDKKYGSKKENSFFENKYGLEFQYLYAYKYVFKGCEGDIENLNGKTITVALPPMFKKIKRDVFRFD